MADSCQPDQSAAAEEDAPYPRRDTCDSLPRVQTSGSLRVDEAQYDMKSLPIDGNFHIFDINLHDGDSCRQNVGQYYTLCKDHKGLHVTTSCFTIWRKHKKTNGYAKVIPAVPVEGSEEDVRIFFFDDNLEWDGTEDSPGICNLRDVCTGEFVDFEEGQNGFSRATASRQTVIYHSSKYRNVLVKANILDAMEDEEYFSSIIERFASPHEKLLVFMDVNSTIVCNDSVQGKDLVNTLLGTMFEFIEIRPSAAFEYSFDKLLPVRIEKPRTLKSVVKEMTSSDSEAYGSFWTEDNCWRLFREVAGHGEVRWSGHEGPFALDDCQRLFQEYRTSLGKVVNEDGIAASWFRAFRALEGRHTVVLNSFGVDTRKVVLATIPDERRVLQVTVNYDLWDMRDMQKFAGQFST